MLSFRQFVRLTKQLVVGDFEAGSNSHVLWPLIPGMLAVGVSPATGMLFMAKLFHVFRSN